MPSKLAVMFFFVSMIDMSNLYYILRHGQSIPNVAGIILSHPEEGKKSDYTLTFQGEEQVRQSVLQRKEGGDLDHETVIISSPFSRCMRTAEIVREILGIDNDIVVDDRLRERWFGDWEKTSNSNYEKVWADDSENPDHTIANVESAREVQKRILNLMHDLDNRYNNKTILLVSHGDALQILLTGLQKQSPAVHRNLPHIETAEIRKIDV